MTDLKIAYYPKQKKWIELSKGSKEYNYKELNGFLVVTLNRLLWGKLQNMIKIRKRGWDTPIVIAGNRRSGKSTLGKLIAYVLDPHITIKNFVIGLEDAPDAIENVKDESTLLFDESVLSFSAKDTLKAKQNQLGKIIDVCGQKKLTLIFILPDFFSLNRNIAITHTLFLLITYTDKQLNRGSFRYYSNKRKKILYQRGKKELGFPSKPKCNFSGKFVNFKLPFEDKYLQLKKDSLKEALGLKNKNKPMTEQEIKHKLINIFIESCPEIPLKLIARGFCISERQIYNVKRGV